MAWTAGEILTAANLTTYLPQTSTTFTPGWAGVTLTSATNAGRYAKIGPMIMCEVVLTFGASTALTDPSMTLPVSSVSGSPIIGSALYSDAGVRTYVGSVFSISSSAVGFIHSESGNGGSLNATNPFTWGTGDVLRMAIQYFWA